MNVRIIKLSTLIDIGGKLIKFKLYLLTSLLVFSVQHYAQDFTVPESAAYDPATGCYYVSNYGNGNIIRINPDGYKIIFQQGLNKSLGMIICQKTLFVVENFKNIRGFNLTDGSESLNLTIGEAQFLNDITSDNNGLLYVTDSRAKAVYQINPVEKTYVQFVKTKTDSPNGILYDKWNNRLIVCYFTEKVCIDEINLEDSTISTLIPAGLTNLDGLTQDLQGNIYVSTWGPGSFQTGFKKQGAIYKFDNQFTNHPTVVADSLYGPADIFYNVEKKEMVIPLFLENTVHFLSLQ